MEAFPFIGSGFEFVAARKRFILLSCINSASVWIFAARALEKGQNATTVFGNERETKITTAKAAPKIVYAFRCFRVLRIVSEECGKGKMKKRGYNVVLPFTKTA